MRRAYPYRNLSEKQFDEVVTMLAEGIASQRGRYGAYLHRDKINGNLKARRGARLAAITSGGAIPRPRSLHRRRRAEGTVVGTLDEDFAVESNSGDIILLGTSRGGSAAWNRADACWWRMRMARRRRFPSGWAKLRRAPLSFRSALAKCVSKSATCMPKSASISPVRRLVGEVPQLRK